MAPANEITVTLVRNEYPRELIKSLEQLGYTINETDGIISVTPKVFFPTQIVISSRLKPESHRALRILTPGAEIDDVLAFVETYRNTDDRRVKEDFAAVLKASLDANVDLIYELRKSYMCDAIMELINQDIADLRAQLVEKDKQILEKDRQILELDKQILELDKQILEKDKQILEKNNQINDLKKESEYLRQSAKA